MSGLDSIALAVAHLEEMSQKGQQHKIGINGNTSAATDAKTTMAARTDDAARISPSPTAMSVLPHPPVASHKSRVVSTDTVNTVTGPTATSVAPVRVENACADSKYRGDTDASSKASIFAPSVPKTASSKLKAANSNEKLNEVLKDPHKWLVKVENELMPPAPTGVIEGALTNDVLCGRGGESNHHPGNQMYRKLVKTFQPLYIASKRRFKPKISECIVYTIRFYGGRFLRRTDPRGRTFSDVGNVKAREKTSQALREGAPELRGNMPANLEEEILNSAPSTQVRLSNGNASYTQVKISSKSPNDEPADSSASSKAPTGAKLKDASLLLPNSILSASVPSKNEQHQQQSQALPHPPPTPHAQHNQSFMNSHFMQMQMDAYNKVYKTGFYGPNVFPHQLYPMQHAMLSEYPHNPSLLAVLAPAPDKQSTRALDGLAVAAAGAKRPSSSISAPRTSASSVATEKSSTVSQGGPRLKRLKLRGDQDGQSEDDETT